MPVTNGMPPLADLLGEAAAGDPQHPPQQPQLVPESGWYSGQTQPAATARAQRRQPGERWVRAALAMLRWYKGALSPLMASTCRFLPTCSQYSMDSYSADRLAAAALQPLGPSGYDPTAWPPVGLAWLFRVEGSAEVAVVVGLATFLRLSHALLFE
ncbi:hypothetical protein COO60DRAFT_1509923 [Scenedesmus sp. NREL 46B-D3]|nr:hypothetical protein COO60DRAFT_1509923 [Scenedesmus sp. NREL 46B-D3]